MTDPCRGIGLEAVDHSLVGHRPRLLCRPAGRGRRLQLGVENVLVGDHGLELLALGRQLGLHGTRRIPCRLGRGDGVAARRPRRPQIGDGPLVGLEGVLEVDVRTLQVLHRSGQPENVGLDGPLLEATTCDREGRFGSLLALLGDHDGGLVLLGVVGLGGDPRQQGGALGAQVVARVRGARR